MLVIKGKAQWSKVFEPDTRFVPEGEYSVQVIVPETEAQDLLDTYCADCHGSPPPHGAWKQNFPGNAINAPANASYDYISPGDYSQSYLWMKMVGDSRITGSQMPRNRPAVPQFDIDAFAAWIQTLQ